MHPFIDPKKLSDDEILAKIGTAYQYLNVQSQLGHDPTVASIKDVVESLENERRERLDALASEERKKKNPKELDPITLGDLDNIPKPVFEDEIERKRVLSNRRRTR